MTGRKRQGKQHKPLKGKTVHQISGAPTLQQQMAQEAIARPRVSQVTYFVKRALNTHRGIRVE